MIETTLLPSSIEQREQVYQDRNQRIHRVIAQFDGFAKEYFVGDHGKRAALVAVRSGEVLLVQQYRLLINGLSFEIPGGRVDDGETPEEAALRECLEETGIRCDNLKRLISFHLGLDVLKNPTYVFYTADFTEEAQKTSGSVVWMPLSRCIEMVFEGQIVDSLSIVALLAYHTLIGQ